ncbi:MAG: presqualene diphosphate synthase HpnD [Ottowia sp.]|nr:presqualene diphosphate synthase HpnD [Ottowia sp.]
MTPEQYCQSKAAVSGSSFYYSFLFLPLPRRQAITALYAFCREVDDVVDQCQDLSVASAKLNWWRQELVDLFSGKPTHPISKALQPHLSDYDIRHEWLNAILDGMEMDLAGSRYPDFGHLKKYCYRVAGVVGILSASIFGYQDKQTLAYAEKLGEALQLINIIRDVGDDARRGRIYLPVNELQRFNVPAADIFNRHYSDHFVALMQFQAERARSIYQEACALLPKIDRRAQRAGLMMAAIYLALLGEIEHENMRVLHQRISLPPLRKLWLAWKVWIRG